ncbi:GltA [Streptomyces sp. MNU77]|uniref:GltA n=1 Tax=Streptomyces sp. MNU77 TaxID=1573406 RepID=UPI002116698A|nr:GltA [Streptomyces sp. MNU77]
MSGQRLPRGWSLQWLVQEDRTEGAQHVELPDRPWISRRTSRTGSTAYARNLALHRADGLLTRALDANCSFPDDSALARDIEVLAAHPELGWTAAPTSQRRPDGTLVTPPHDGSPGPLPAGHFAALVRADRRPAAATAATFYTELVVALRGWPPLPALNDLALLLAAEGVSGGWLQARAGAVRTGGTTPPDADHLPHASEDVTAVQDLLLGRAEALRTLGWSWRPEVPVTL